MAINKVKFGNNTLIDLTGTTATSDKILTGYGAFGRDGVWMDGSLVPGADDGYVYQDQDNYVVLDDDEGVGVGVTPLNVTSNGTYNAGTRRAYNPVTVNVQPTLQSKSVTPTESQQTITPDSGKYGLSQVVVAGIDAGYVGSSVPRKTSSDLTATSWSYSSNTTYDYISPTISMPAGYYSTSANMGFTKILTDITGLPKQSAVTITPTEARQTAAQSRRWLNGNITVAGISSTYVGSGVPTKSSADLTRNGATVTVPAGYYSGQATKSVASMTLPTATATTSVGTLKSTIARSTATRYINIPTGYNSASGTYKIESVANGTATTPATTITTNPTITVNSSGLITATNSKTQSVTPTVSAGYVSTGTAGTITISGSATSQLTTKGATTYTPTTTNQTIASGTYLTGAQTISGDSNLVASNIKKDVTIFGITGTAETEPNLIAKTVTPTAETQIVTPDVETLIINNGTFADSVLGYQADTLNNLVSNMPFINISTFTIPVTLRVKLTVERIGGNTYSVDDLVNIPYQTNYYTVKTFSSSDDIGSVRVRWYNSVFQIGVAINKTGNYRIIPNTVDNPNVFEIYKVETGVYDGLSQVTVNGDADLIAENIKKDVEIFGVTGTFESLPEPHNATVIFAENTKEGRTDPSGGVNYDGTWYRSSFSSFTFNPGETININSGDGWDDPRTGTITIDGTIVASDSEGAAYTYTLPEKDINIVLKTTATGGTAELYTYSATDMTKQVMLNSYPSYYMIPSGFSSLGSYALNGRNVSYLIANPSLRVIGPWRCANMQILSSVYLNNVSWIVHHGFYNNPRLNYVSAPHLSSIHSSAFMYCPSLKSMDLPEVRYIDAYAFSSCMRMSYISIPKVSRIQNGAFMDCRVLSEIYGPSVSAIGYSAFVRCYSLTTASFPVATSVSQQRFYTCSALTSIYMPNVSVLESSAFQGCSNLSGNISFSLVSRIEIGVFNGCSKIETVDFASASYMASNAFTNCQALTFASVPHTSTIGSSRFSGCINLLSINMPEVINIYNNAFSGCSALSYVNFPEVAYMSYGVFTACFNLSTVILPKLSYMRSSMFNRCYNLLSVYLLSTSVIGGGTNWSIFTSTPISNYTTSTGGVYGSIFVPASLYDSYISASGWSLYSSRFVSLTDAQISAILNS